VILLDLGLPDSQGLSTLTKLNEIKPDAPVIVLTGLKDESVGVQAVHEGAQDYLIKGQVDSRLLMRSINYAVERKYVESALKITGETLETIFNNTHIMLAYLDTDFNFIRVNRAYASADDRQPEFFPGKNHFAIYPNSENEEIFRNVVKTGESHVAYSKAFEYTEHPERGISYWDWTVQPIKDSKDKVVSLVLSLIDVTKRKTAEDETQKRIKELEVFYEASIGREIKMKELKHEIDKLHHEAEILKVELARYKK
jgi:PAS domain S-box-containing protein